MIRDLDLERGDAGQGALRRAYLGGVVGLGGEVVTEKRCLGSESVTGELHAVTGVTRKPNDDLFQFFPRVRPVERTVLHGVARTHVPAFRPCVYTFLMYPAESPPRRCPRRDAPTKKPTRGWCHC